MLYIFTTYDFIEKISNLNKKQKIIILLISLIIILSVVTSILKSSLKDVDDTWEYDKIGDLESIEEYLDNDKKINNRVKYWELDKIIDKYIATISNNSKYSYKKYYKILTDEYKKELKQVKYNLLSYDFINRFVYEIDGDYEKVSYSIKDIYLYDNNMYLCYISVDLDEMSENQINMYYNYNDNEDIEIEKKHDGYIGIKLNSVKETYSIFYIE